MSWQLAADYGGTNLSDAKTGHKIDRGDCPDGTYSKVLEIACENEVGQAVLGGDTLHGVLKIGDVQSRRRFRTMESSVVKSLRFSILP